jgi:4-hydroxy-tetrahydrodipicolinate synthase
MIMNYRFEGIFTALITPFNSEGDIDREGLGILIENQVKKGVSGVVVIAGSGEHVNLSFEEKAEVVKICMETASRRIQVVAGILSTNTRDAVACAKAAQELGVDAVLVSTPFYNKPSRNGIYNHYYAISDTCDIPILVYNIPGRTGINLDTSDYIELSKRDNIVGVKECNRDLSSLSNSILELGSRWSVLSGEDDLLYPSMALGSPGGVLTTSNIIPEYWVKMCKLMSKHDYKAAVDIHYKLIGLYNVIMLPNHPSLVKKALTLMGLPAGPTRAPLSEPTLAQIDRLEVVLGELELL